MPVRHTIRFDIEDSFYHVYNQGNNKASIFLDSKDKDFFISLAEKYLTEPKPKEITKGAALTESFYGKLELTCYCLMGNHYHFLVYQHEPGSLARFMKALSNSYVGYFNRRYGRRGGLFESRYKASLIEYQPYLDHITRYIHLNPKDWENHKYSSLPIFLGRGIGEFVHPERVLQHVELGDYLAFMKDYAGHKEILDEIKYDLADK